MGWVSNLGAWLDRKFPDKVTLTPKQMQDFIGHTHPIAIDPAIQDRLARIEADLTKIKVIVNLRNLVKS